MSVRSEMNPKREIFFNKHSNFMDAFGRLRVSTPTIIFHSQLHYGLEPGHWLSQVTTHTGSTVTHISSEASAQLAVDGATQSSIRQTREYFKYQPGTSQLILMTFGNVVGQAGVTKHVGYGDANNGLFLKTDGTGTYFVRRSDSTGVVVNTEVEQASWNLDKLDGTGPSRVTLDFSKVQILVVDIEWLGVGRVRLGFVVDGVYIYAHEFLQANIGTGVYMRTPNLPLRYQLTGTTGLSSSVTLKQICGSVMSEGGDDTPIGHLRTKSNSASLIAVTSATGAHVELLSIRPRLTYQGKTNRTHIVVSGFSVFSEDADIHYEIVWGGVSNSSAAGWLPVSTAYSGMDYTVSGGITTGGLTVSEGYIPAATQGSFNFAGAERQAFEHSIKLSLNVDGDGHTTVPTDTFTDQLTIRALTLGTDSDVGCSINWVEEY